MTTGNRICTRCVMDTTDPEISFDADGVCNHCHDYDREVLKRVRTYFLENEKDAVEAVFTVSGISFS